MEKNSLKIIDDLVYVLRRRRANRKNDQFSVIGVFTSAKEISDYIAGLPDKADKYNYKCYKLDHGAYI